MNTGTKKLAILAMLSAAAYVVMYFGRIPVVLFLKYDPKDVILAIGGFIFGPLSAAAMSVVVSLAEMVTASETGPIGAVMNILSSCAFVCTAAFIYKKKHTLTGAVIGLVSGMFLMTAVMLLWNYLLVPLYTPNISRETVLGMLVPVFLPFNLLKSGLNAGITMLIYKPVRLALGQSRLLPESNAGTGRKSLSINLGTILISLFVVMTGVLLILLFQGKI